MWGDTQVDVWDEGCRTKLGTQVCGGSGVTQVQEGCGNPCIFWHSGRALRVVVHGDDFTALGHKDELEWLVEEMEVHFELKVKAKLGPAPGDDKAVRILNRVVEWS